MKMPTHESAYQSTVGVAAGTAVTVILAAPPGNLAPPTVPNPNLHFPTARSKSSISRKHRQPRHTNRKSFPEYVSTPLCSGARPCSINPGNDLCTHDTLPLPY